MITVVLRRRFLFSPPLLSSIIKPFAGHEHMFRFLDLVQEYMPEQREKFLTMAPKDAAVLFVKVFTKRYFPVTIPFYWSDSADFIKRLVQHIPAERHHITEHLYEPVYEKLPPGQLLAEVLCVCPFRGDDRLAVVERFKKLFGPGAAAVLKLIPAKGYTLRELEAAPSMAPYKGLLERCKWVLGKTGNCWLDKGVVDMTWSRENVDRLTQD